MHDIPLVGLAADVICPERCAACPSLVHPLQLFCANCLARVAPLIPPECSRCGIPQPAPGPCATCRFEASPVRMARAWASYHHGTGPSPVANAIAHFKYGGARRLGRRLAAMLLARVPDPTVTLVIPVPLHPHRLRQRGFNQSAVLARHLARPLGCPVALSVVARQRDTSTQTTLDPRARAANVAGAFAVREPARVRGHTILLVDDVWTSGATASAVASTLRSAGAAAVDVVTLARVLHASPRPP